MLQVRAAHPYCMYMLYVRTACPSSISTRTCHCSCCKSISMLHVHVNAAWSRQCWMCQVLVLHVHAAWLIVHAASHSESLCCTYSAVYAAFLLYVHAECPSSMSMLHAHAACQCCMSILHDQALYSFVHVDATLSMSMLHIHVAATYLF